MTDTPKADQQSTPYTPTPWASEQWNYDLRNPPAKVPVVIGGDFRVAGMDSDEGNDNPYTIPLDQATSNASLIVAAVNSYAKHCGPSAIQCAEDDLLGQALDALRAIQFGAAYGMSATHFNNIISNVLSRVSEAKQA